MINFLEVAKIKLVIFAHGKFVKLKLQLCKREVKDYVLHLNLKNFLEVLLQFVALFELETCELLCSH